MSPAIFRRLPMLRQVIAVLLLIVMALGAPGSAMAAEFDLDRLRATPPPSKTNLAEEVIRADQNARDNMRQKRVDELGQLLARDRKKWQDLRRQLDRELADVIEQANEHAQRDAANRSWITFFQLVGLGASIAQRFVSETPAGQSTPEAGDSPDGTHVKEQYQRDVKWCKDGRCWEIETQKIINEVFTPAAGAKSPEARQWASELHQAAARLPQLPPIQICDSGVPECVPLKPVQQPVVPEIFATLPFNDIDGSGTQSQPSGGQQLASLLMDLVPYFGSAKSFSEFVSGKDPITGEAVSKTAAAVGIVAGVTPGGKLLVKVIKGGVGNRAIIKGTRVFRHYTNRKGSNAIAREGMIRAGDDGVVYAVPAERPVWSSATAARRLDIPPSKSRDYVEFELPKNKTFTKRAHRVTGEEEFLIPGDVRLDQNPAKAVVIQRD